METLMSLPWREYPAAALIGVGGFLTVRAVLQCRAAWPRLSGSMQPLAWMQGFRLTIIGLAVVGVGAAWLWQAGWLFILSLAVAGEETLETTICVSALKRARRDPGVGIREAARL